MAIALTALALDHRRGDPQSPTLPLRFYDQRCVLIPEWGIGAAADVPVAFIRNRLTPAISILARFAATPDERVNVRDIRKVLAKCLQNRLERLSVE